MVLHWTYIVKMQMFYTNVKKRHIHATGKWNSHFSHMQNYQYISLWFPAVSGNCIHPWKNTLSYKLCRDIQSLKRLFDIYYIISTFIMIKTLKCANHDDEGNRTAVLSPCKTRFIIPRYRINHFNNNMGQKSLGITQNTVYFTHGWTSVVFCPLWLDLHKIERIIISQSTSP